MAIDLSAALTRVSALLSDTGNSLWATADVTNAIRLALGEMSLAAGATLTLNGLDGAAVTTIPAVLEGALVVGSAAYAASARQVDKADFEVLSEAKEIKPWVDSQMAAFRRMLEMQYPAGAARTAAMRASASPWGLWSDDWGEKSKG